MLTPSRREFLVRTSALGLGGLMLPDLVRAGMNLEVPATMSIVRGPEGEQRSDLIAKMTVEAIDALGGMSQFVSKGDVVWVKPNIGWDRKPELAANTHPQVVASIVRMCFEAGAKTVKVGDHPCNDPRQSYTNSGIGPAVKKLGAEVVYLDPRRFREMKIGGERLKDHPVYPAIIESDLVINVPVCKHHGSTRVSLCMKNYMGVVDRRRAFHQDLPTTISDITQFMKPRLCVLDATRMLIAHGPTGGDPKDVVWKQVVAAGTDIVALDAFGAELLGHRPEEIRTIKSGVKYGLGTLDYKSLHPQELKVA